MKVLGIGIILCLICSPEARAQVFPGATAGNKDLYVAVGGVSTTITAAVTATSTSFTVSSVANMQPFELLVIDNEIVEMCSFTPSPLAITLGKNSCPGADGRGIGGTSAASHANGARIMDLITAEHHNAARKEIIAIETALGPNLANVPGTPNGPITPITKGGTGASTQAGALANILGVTPLPSNGLCFTSGAGPANCITPGASGTVLTSTGTASLPNWGPGGGGTGGVSSVFGRMGTVAAQAGDYTAALVTNAVDQTGAYPNPSWITSLSWVKITGAPSFVTNPMITAGDFIVGGTAGNATRLAVPGTGTFCPNWSSGGAVTWIACPGAGGSGITSVGITMPSGFTVTGSPLTANGVIGITGAGNATQYINGLGQLATLPTTVTSVFGRTGAVVAASGDYTTAQVTEMTNLYFTNARVYASLSATAPIVFSAGVISCPTCGSGGGGAVSSVFGRTGVVVAAAGDYNATQVTNAENVLNKDTNGGYVGRSSAGSATLPASVTANTFLSSDSTHTSLVSLIPGANTNFPYTVPTGQWGVYLDSGNGNKMTRQDSMGNKVVIEQAGTLVTGQPYVQSFTSTTSVALTHNLGLSPVTAFNIDCFDTTGALIFPSSVTATSSNTVTATFAVATSGSCTVTTGGTATSTGGGMTQLTGDVTAGPGSGSQAATLATVNSGPGSCGDATHVCQVTTNGKGLVTAQSAITITGGGGASFGYNAYTGSAAIAFGTYNAVLVTASGANPTLTVASNPASNGTPIWIGLCNDTAARVWTVPANFQQISTPIDASQCVYTAATWNGTNYQGTGGNSAPILIQGPERTAPGTPAATFTSIWPDSTRHTWTSLSNGSANSHIMPRCAGTTDQCALGDLSNGTAAGVVSLFTGCSGTQYLGADGACHTPSGGITGPGTTTNLFIPQWNGTTGTALGAGLAVTQAAAANSLVETGAGGTIAAGLVPTLNQSTTGNAATATALAATPTPCPAAQFATGIAASGNAICASAVTGPGSVTQFRVPQWGTTVGNNLIGGIGVTQTTATANSLVQTSAVAGTIDPILIPAVTVTTSTSAPTDSGSYTIEYFFNNAAGALTFTLPAGTLAGFERCYRNTTGRTGAITVAVPTGAQIDLNGANGTLSTGTLVSGGALGDSVCLVTDASNHWMATVNRGTWTNN